ncbi:MAG: RimK family alpha-L-glutamate ligase [Methanosarcinaceae archaeon]|nr:RimK family alpha-L-glutamate ligase [Methanosarcinaceae archaeon]
MKGWILYKDSASGLKPEAYEVHRLLKAAEENGIEMQVVKPEQFELIVTRDDRKSVLLDGEVVPLPDFLLPRMGAGTTYFAMAVIRHLERLGVHTFNSSESIDTVKDKLYSSQILAEMDIPFPKTMLAKYPIDVNFVEKQFGFPLIIKILTGSKGSGVFLSENRTNFIDLMELIRVTKSYANFILQEFISSSRGHDLRVFVIGGRVVACMERIATDGNFKANFSRGGEVRQFEITAEIEWLATETARIFGLDIAGIDLLFDGDHFKICEANSSPGFEGIESCCDIDIPKEIYNFIRIRLGMYEDNE